jgi:hypothetical protein
VSVEDLLSQGRTEALDEAFAVLERCHVVHYESSGEDFARERLAELFGIVTAALGDREQAPVCRYAEGVAEQRFEAGFEILELQSAFSASHRRVPSLDLSALFSGVEA